MKTFWKFVLAAIVMRGLTYAQVLDWGDPCGPLSPPSSYEVGGVVSDGYGQHVVTTSNHAGTSGPQTDVTYYLFGNNGELIRTNVWTEEPLRSYHSTITSSRGLLTVVYSDAPDPQHSIWYLRISQSTNGGENWSASTSIQTTIEPDYLDALTDQNGTHIVFSSPSEVRYIRFRPNNTPQWTDPKNLTDLGYPFGARGYAPKVVANGTAITVSFVAYENSTGTSATSVASRDGELTTNGGISWENSVRDATASGFNASAQSVARRGNDYYLMIAKQDVPPKSIRTSVRSGSGSWSEPAFFDYSGDDEYQNHNRKLILFGDTLLTCYSISTSVWFSQNMGAIWSTPFEVDEQAPPITLRRSTISASRTGVYVFWNRGVAASLWMCRKPYALSGHISENMYWTDENWITDDVTIDAGYTVTLKTGSTTYVSANKKIIVQNGASLIKEQGSQIVWGENAAYQLNTTLLNGWNMAGIPTVLSDFTASSVYPTKTSYVFACNGSSYVIMDPLTNDRGWWVKFGYAQAHVYEGGYIDYMAMVANNGWNIIGSISSPVATSSVSSEPDGIIVPYYFKYDNGYTVIDTLKPGPGYWVKTTGDGHIILDAGSDGDLGRGIPGLPDQITDAFDSYDHFRVTDANGGMQHLYVRNAEVAGTTKNIEMPPPAPDNAFDVRFSPGQYLQSVTPDSEGIDLSIALNSVMYPVEISWEINPENGLTYTNLPEGGGLGKGTSLTRRSKGMVIQSKGSGFVHFNVSNRKVEESQLPTQFSLQQNYPNPFNPSTVISYDIPASVHVTLTVYDVLGRKVMALVNGIVEAGYHQTMLNASNLASGMYFYQLQAGSYTSVKKLVVLK